MKRGREKAAGKTGREEERRGENKEEERREEEGGLELEGETDSTVRAVQVTKRKK